MGKQFSKTKRKIIFESSSKKCCLCNKELHNDINNCFDSNYMQIDHILPKSLNGSNDLSNLRAICKSCNSRRRNLSSDVLKDNIINNANKFEIEKYSSLIIDEFKNNLIDVYDILNFKKEIENNYKKNMECIEKILKEVH